MTAGLFAKHGVWFGNCGGPTAANRKGNFENKQIKRAQIDRWGMLTLARQKTAFEENPVCEYRGGFRPAVEKILAAEGYEGGYWGYKQSALYKPAWGDFEPYFVGVRRENVVQANITRQNFMGTANVNRIQRVVDLHDPVIDECEVIVKTDELISGEYRTIREAFDYCGLKFRPEIAKNWISPELWHH